MSEQEKAAEQPQESGTSEFNVTPERVREVIREHVYDPEIGLNVIDLGLVYDIKVLPEEKKAIVTMTLTSPGCPVGPQILAATERWLHEEIPELDEVEIQLVWTPLWNPSMMSDEAKDMLGIF